MDIEKLLETLAQIDGVPIYKSCPAGGSTGGNYGPHDSHFDVIIGTDVKGVKGYYIPCKRHLQLYLTSTYLESVFTIVADLRKEK